MLARWSSERFIFTGPALGGPAYITVITVANMLRQTGCGYIGAANCAQVYFGENR
jgi:hypothetical protein